MSGFVDAVCVAITQALGAPFAAVASQAVHGGDISEALRLDAADRSVFVKTQPAAQLAMFEAEAAGLAELAAANAVRVPQVIACGLAGGRAYLALEHLSLGARGDAERLGRQLAMQHRSVADRFGGARDNWIGATPQPNAWRDRWVDFWRDQRLGHQLKLAADKGYGGALQRDGEALRARLEEFFVDYPPRPSLLHGDLWGGNHGFLADGTPVLFDPAVYYGDRECDLAMSELFGGFAPAFHAAYREAWPLDPGYPVRRTLYNLYHILNHANLFGGGYVTQAQRVASQLLAELH
jgi:fructosamine-3-kinase